jgi:hypothetical protein
MRRLLMLAAVTAAVTAVSGCRCGGLFRRHNGCERVECSSCCEGSSDAHEVYSDGEFAPVWEETIPVPRAR